MVGLNLIREVYKIKTCYHALLFPFVSNSLLQCMHHAFSADWVDRIYSSVKYTHSAKSDLVQFLAIYWEYKAARNLIQLV